jgi:acetyl esterase/lipase
MLRWSLCVFLAVAPAMCDRTLAEAQVIRIWPGAAPGSEAWTHGEIEFYAKPLPAAPHLKMIRDVVIPTLTVFHAPHARDTGAAIIICPGGAFRLLDWVNEGTNAAEWFAAHGITAFVLKYRLAQTPAAPEQFARAMTALTPAKTSDAPKRLKDIFGDTQSLDALALGIADARQAVRVVRKRAAEWHLAPDRIGMLGFSAGAFVTIGAVLEGDRNERPNFVGAVYGGESGGRSIPADAPPLFVAVAQDDEMGLAGISETLYSDWRAAGAAAELHIFSAGGHGFGTIKQHLPVDHWLELFGYWIRAQGFAGQSE